MSKLRLSLLLSVLFLFAGYHTVLGSYSSPTGIYARDGNSTLVPSTPVNFPFPVPSNSHDPNFSNWVTVVCLNVRVPTLGSDECNIEGFRRCPNSDVSGILVRVSTYLLNLLLGIVIMYDPKEASAGVWTQLLTVYSLLISAIVAVLTNKGLTRFHSGMTVFLVFSPLSLSLLVYTILGFCGRPHRLDSILSSRREHLLPRLAVILFWIIAMGLMIFTTISKGLHFTPAPPCDNLRDHGAFAAVLYCMASLPYVGVAIVIITVYENYKEGYMSKEIYTISATPLLLLVFAVVGAVINSRHSIQEQVKMLNINGRLKIFWAKWELFATHYPFIHFCGVFLVPMIYWVVLNEIRLLGTPDNIFSPSFGQMMAVFVVLQPLLQVIMMSPRVIGWFSNLTVIRLFTGRPKHFWAGYYHSG
ncbi:hypothetical protein K438DRAFT_1829324 [Mycena galopus ATCC 62051]|nr:hypothetical protein K438DRAFT_1829324 [Mycena galopus ATCC 62051]